MRRLEIGDKKGDKESLFPLPQRGLFMLPPDAPTVRDYGSVNWLGLWTLVRKEVGRFTKIYNQTLFAPVLVSLIFFTIFSVAMGGSQRLIVIPPYAVPVNAMLFIAPGLAMMTLLQNAYMNSSSSIVTSKLQGNLIDILVAPLSALELAVGYMLGGLLRGVTVCALTMLALWALMPLPVYSWGHIIFFCISSAMLLSLWGIIGGLWANKFDQLATLQNFFIMPATFLSGVFYTSNQLGPHWQILVHMNPFFYMIDGFRYGFIGQADSVITIGIGVMIVANLLSFGIVYRLFDKGWRIRS